MIANIVKKYNHNDDYKFFFQGGILNSIKSESFESLNNLVADLLVDNGDKKRLIDQEKHIYNLFVKNSEQLIGNLIAEPKDTNRKYEDLRSSLSRLEEKEYCKE